MEKDTDQAGFQGMHVARVFLFFSFTYRSIFYPCALVHWFSPIDAKPCEDTGLWIVQPDFLSAVRARLSAAQAFQNPRPGPGSGLGLGLGLHEPGLWLYSDNNNNLGATHHHHPLQTHHQHQYH